MWIYEKRLEFPVNIKEPNAKMAMFIMSQYGGPDGEMGASMRYLSQRYSMPYKCSHFPKIGTTPLRDCPLSTGKRLTLSGKQYGNWKMPDIYSVQGNVMRKDAYAVQRMLSMSSRQSWIYLHWKNQHWIIQHWKSLCWKNLRWKIQRN